MNVLALSTTFIPSVLLCGHCQLDYLEKHNIINYKFVPSHFVKKENVDWADVIVFIRSDTDIDAYVSKLAKKSNKHTIYVLDDDILNAPSYLSCYPYYSLPSTKNNILKTMKNCDTFLTPSPVLLEKYGNMFNNKYLIDEPSLNRINAKDANSKVKIGFAGSIDRTNDIEKILSKAIKILIDKYGNKIEFEFMGAKPSFVDELNIKYLPYQDGYDSYTAYMSKCNWDIGLAPMPDTDFHKCKYFNKYIEYASFGIVGVYSNLKPYIYGIKNRNNGILVNNTTEEWVNAISELIDNEELRKELSNTCLNETRDKYALDKIAKDYFDKISENYCENNTKVVGCFVLAKFIFFVKRVYRKIIEEGSNFPNWLKKKIDKKIEEYNNIKRHKRNAIKLNNIIDKQNSVFIIGPYDLNNNDEYSARIKYIDKELLNKNYLVYLNGEDRGLEHIETRFVNRNHAEVYFNSYDIYQTDTILKMIERSGYCIVHSVDRFIREKLSSDMKKIFELPNTIVVLDSHGLIPEKYEANSNSYAEMITNDIEKMFYYNANYLLVRNDSEKRHFISKYGEGAIEIVVVPSEDGINKMKKIFNRE